MDSEIAIKARIAKAIVLLHLITFLFVNNDFAFRWQSYGKFVTQSLSGYYNSVTMVVGLLLLVLFLLFLFPYSEKVAQVDEILFHYDAYSLSVET